MQIATEAALRYYIASKAEDEGKSPDEVAREVTPESFEAYVRELHEQFMAGEFSQGEMADLLGLPRLELIHLLENMGLQVTNI